MKAVRFLGAGQVRLEDVPVPVPRGAEVVIRVKAASICGTDRENLCGKGQATIPGHENAGVISAVDAPIRLKPGDRIALNCHVTCGRCVHCRNGDLYFCDQLTVIGFDRDGGFAEYVLAPESSCMPIPDSISFEQASLMVDMLGTPYRAFSRAQVEPGERIAVWGAGPIGLGLLMTAKSRGVRVAVVDTNAYRLDMARGLASDLLLNALTDDIPGALGAWTEGKGVRVGFDCVGSETVCRQILGTLAKRGTLVIVGVSRSLTLDPWEHFIQRELTVLGSRNFNLRDFSGMISLVQEGLPLDKVITHRFPLRRAEEAFSTFLGQRCGKVLLVDETPKAHPSGG